jgi:putative SOS response-associated peptidase YedK
MCGRVYEIYTAEQLSERFEATPDFEVSTSYNLCPTENLPVLRVADGRRQFEQMRWQLVPKTEPIFATKLSTINARSESVFTSRLYRDLVVRQRCIVPISGFYEWRAKQPYRIHLRTEPIMSVAGIWDAWRPGTKDERHSFSILTTSANEFMSAIHDRMPVILGRPDEEAWLDPGFQDAEALKKILKPCPSSVLESSEVPPELLRPARTPKTATLFEI